MSRKILHDLTSLEDVRRLLEGFSIVSNKKEILIEYSSGHILAEDIIPDIDVPSFSKALKDGYALRSMDTANADSDSPAVLNAGGFIPVGQWDRSSVQAGGSHEIATGAPVPEGADAVVMVEDTRRRGDSVLVYSSLRSGENILPAGMDMAMDEMILHKGLKLAPRHIGVLAAVGQSMVWVRSVTVGIISTGNEITIPGAPLEPGMIYDTNSYTLYAAARECGADAKMYGIVRDNRHAMEQALVHAVYECDIVLTSGSTSAGVDDVMYRIIEDKGQLLVHGINFKPGKPVIIGMMDDVAVIGLPGSPTSALVVFNELVAPLIRRTLGMTHASRPRRQATLATDIHSEDRHELLSVRLDGNRVYPADKTSASITTLAQADGFIEIGAGVKFVKAGTDVEVTLFSMNAGGEADL